MDALLVFCCLLPDMALDFVWDAQCIQLEDVSCSREDPCGRLSLMVLCVVSGVRVQQGIVTVKTACSGVFILVCSKTRISL